MVEQCPCCGSDRITSKRERVQNNGLRMGGGRCHKCDFTWTTINGQVSHNSINSIESHQKFMLGRGGGWRY